jgi:hypothetical protein
MRVLLSLGEHVESFAGLERKPDAFLAEHSGVLVAAA